MAGKRNFELEEKTREEILVQEHISLTFAELDLKNREDMLLFLRIKYNDLELANWACRWLDDLNFPINPELYESRTIHDEYYSPEFVQYLIDNRYHLDELQKEVKKYIKVFHQYQVAGKEILLNKDKTGGILTPPPFPYAEDFLQKLNEMNFSFFTMQNFITASMKDENGFDNPFSLAIQLKPKNFEQIMYYNLMELLNYKHQFIQCSLCKKTILNPSGQQLGKFRTTGNATHTDCREPYKSMKSAERKKKWRQKKKQQALSITKEEN